MKSTAVWRFITAKSLLLQDSKHGMSAPSGTIKKTYLIPFENDFDSSPSGVFVWVDRFTRVETVALTSDRIDRFQSLTVWIDSDQEMCVATSVEEIIPT